MNQNFIIEEVEKRLLIENLPEEVRSEVITRLSEAVLERTILTLVASLTEDEARIVTELQERGAVEEIFSYISEKHPEVEAKVLTLINDVITEFLTA